MPREDNHEGKEGDGQKKSSTTMRSEAIFGPQERWQRLRRTDIVRPVTIRVASKQAKPHPQAWRSVSTHR
jgi:hypothetical protein